jgi:hypothetical protein
MSSTPARHDEEEPDAEIEKVILARLKTYDAEEKKAKDADEVLDRIQAKLKHPAHQ